MLDMKILNQELNAKGALINAPKAWLKVPTLPIGDGTPHLEISKEKSFYVTTERGMEISRVEITSLDEILYIIFNSITFRVASEIFCPDQLLIG